MKRLILIALAIFSLAVFSQENLELIQQWASGPCRTVYATPDAIFMGNGNRIDVLNANTHVLRSRTMFSNIIQDITYKDSHIFVAVKNKGLYVYAFNGLDGNLIFRSFVATEGDARKVAVQGDYAYVADGNGGLGIIYAPVSTTQHALIRTVDFDEPVLDVYLTTNYAFLAIDALGIVSVNIQNKQNPVVADTVNISDSARAITGQGNTVYLADQASGLYVFNVTDPVHMVQSGQWGEGVDNINIVDIMVDAEDENAYLADNGFGLRVVNLSTLTQKTLLKTDGDALSLFYKDQIFLADGATGLKIIDVSTVPPEQTKRIISGDRALDVLMTSQATYVAAGRSGLWVIDNDNINPENIIIAKNYATTSAQGLDLYGNTLFLADSSGGLRSYNISTPLSPEFRDQVATAGTAMDVIVYADSAYVADGASGVTVVDVNNPSEMVNRGNETTGGFNAVGLGIDPRSMILYAAAGADGVKFINLATTQVVGTYQNESQAMGVTVKSPADTVIYVADGVNGLEIVNVKNLETPHMQSQFVTDGTAYDVGFRNDLAVVADGKGTVRLINADDINNLNEVDNFHTIGTSYAVDVMNDTIVVADGEGGVYFLKGYFGGLLAANEDSLDFANVLIGKNRVLQLTLVNNGLNSVAIQELSSNSGRFLTKDLPGTLGSGDVRTINIAFYPVDNVTYTDTLKIQSDALNGTIRIPVTGTGISQTSLSAYTPDNYTYALYHMDRIVPADVMLDGSQWGYLDGVLNTVIENTQYSGKFDKAYKFDGEDLVTVQMDSFLYLPQDWKGVTLETWFKLATFPKDTAVLCRISDSNRILFELSVIQRKLIARSSKSAGADNIILLQADQEVALDTMIWYHAAITMADIIKLYLNGDLLDTDDSDINSPEGVLSFTIGNDLARSSGFRGYIDELRLSGIARQPWEFNVGAGRFQTNYQALNFGSQYVNTTSYARYLYVTNTGQGPLNVDSVYTRKSQYSVNVSEFQLNSGTNRWVQVRFTPTTVSQVLDTLFFKTDDPMHSLVKIPLYGSGINTRWTGSYVADAATNGLWHLDGTAGQDSIRDASVNKMIGYFRGSGISWSDIFKYGTSSLRFTGDTSWVRVANNANLDFTRSEFTLESWLRLNSKPGANGYYTIFRRGTGNKIQYEVLFGDSLGGNRGLVARVYGSNGTAYTLHGPSASEVDLNAWHQFAFSWDLNKLRLLWNGVAVDSLIFNGQLRSSNGNLAIGGNFGTGRGLNGMLDEIRFSNIRRSTDQLNFIGPIIAVNAETLVFDETLIGDSQSHTFTIGNTGGQTLTVTGITAKTGVFSATPNSVNINPAGNAEITLRFHPANVGIIRDTLTIVNNDPDSSHYLLYVSGEGVDFREQIPYVSDEYTVALLHLDETSGIISYDSSSSNPRHNGNVNGAVWTTSGYFAGALNFDGINDYLSIPDRTDLRFDMNEESFTIECIFKTDTIDQVIFFKDPYSGANRGNFGLTVNKDGMLALHGFGTGNTWVAGGIWHHAAMVYDAIIKRATLYLDGNIELQGVWKKGDTDVQTPGPLLFGARETVAGNRIQFLDGAIDEIRISKVARKPWELLFKQPGIYTTLAAQPVKGQSVNVNITVPAKAGSKSVQLYYRPGGKSAYTIASKSGSSSQYTATIPASAVTERGLEYYVKMSFNDTTVTQPVYDPINHPMVSRVRFNSLPFDSSLVKKTYRMISVPVDLNDAYAGHVLSDDLGAWNPYSWRLFGWRDTSYVEFSDAANIEFGDTLSYSDTLLFSMAPGKAFWVIDSTHKNLDVGNGYSVSTASGAFMTIRPQWNMLGSPFPFPVHWNDCVLGSDSLETLTYYDGKGYRLDWPVLYPWCGYWMFNQSRNYHKFYVPPRESQLSKASLPKGAVLENLADHEWMFKFSVTSENAEDLDNYAGVRNLANIQYDQFDKYEPPPIGDYVTFYFDHSEWKTNGGTYAADIRPCSEEGHIWKFNIESRIANKSMSLSWEQFQSIPANWEARLLDLDEGTSVRLNDISSITIQTQEKRPNSREFALLIGPSEFVDKNVGLMQPSGFQVFQNYPNPFNPTTSIQYALNKADYVELSIFNMLGQKVMTLVNENQKAGMHHARWDGLNALGLQVSSGVYFYQVKTSDKIAIRKMMLVR